MIFTEFSQDLPHLRSARKWRDDDGNCFYLYPDKEGSGYVLMIERRIGAKLFALEHGDLSSDNEVLVNNAQRLLQMKMKIKRMTLGDLPGDGRVVYGHDDLGNPVMRRLT